MDMMDKDQNTPQQGQKDIYNYVMKMKLFLKNSTRKKL
jgi:hypothetical protein